MQKRRKSSPNYPQKPQKKTHTKSGENEEGYKRGRYNRDSTNERNVVDYNGGKLSHQGRGAPKRRGKPNKKPKSNTPRVTSDDKITEGKYKGRQILLSESPKMAPTGWKLRETLFRILYRRVRANRFLDICAGTGTVGIEAISRGALLATMVERKAKNCALIRKNLEELEISEGHGEIVESEVIPFLKQMSKRRRFWDVVFFSPPFDYDYDEALACFARGFSIKPGGVFVIEHHAEMFFPERIGVLRRWKVVVEDEQAISFYDRDK